MLARKALAGTAGAPKVYVEDVFSTYLYSGTGSSQTITNNIDLSSKGGAVWSKQRTGVSSSHVIVDTVRGVGKTIYPDSTTTEFSGGSPIQTITAFNNNGYSLGTNANFNRSGDNFVSWTFRKAEKFFDVVTYTGNGSGGRTINHNLGSAPGCIIIKCTSTTSNWMVWHRSISGQDNLRLNTTDSTSGVSTDPISVSGFPSSLSTTQFTVDVGSGSDHCNQNGDTYVAYLFAHDAGGFGDAGSDSIIKCGSFTTNGSGNATVTLDWEPQWILYKPSSSAGEWELSDTMRGWSNTSISRLYANTSDSEQTYTANTPNTPNATGFQFTGLLNASSTYIYIAIRRGPMKTPTSGTSVFNTMLVTGNGTNERQITGVGFPPDLLIGKRRSSALLPFWFDKLRGKERYLDSSSTSAETALAAGNEGLMLQDGFVIDNNYGSLNVNASTYADWVMRRAPGFFDVVCYDGNSTSGRTVSHNLGVAPELIIVKSRNTATNWGVYCQPLGNTKRLILNLNVADNADSTYWNDTSPTSSVFYVGNSANVNTTTQTYVAYLFASLSGVSKIGTYTGNGSSVTVTTNFQPRFILVKRTDSTGDWIVSDSARGLVAGNDPYLELNTADAEVTNEDWVDISSTSFTVNQTTNNANVNTGTYIYLAIA